MVGLNQWFAENENEDESDNSESCAGSRQVDDCERNAEYGLQDWLLVTNLYDAFQILEKYGEPLYKEEKLRLLFNKSQNTHPEFKQEVVISRTLCTTFESAVIH